MLSPAQWSSSVQLLQLASLCSQMSRIAIRSLRNPIYPLYFQHYPRDIAKCPHIIIILSACPRSKYILRTSQDILMCPHTLYHYYTQQLHVFVSGPICLQDSMDIPICPHTLYLSPVQHILRISDISRYPGYPNISSNSVLLQCPRSNISLGYPRISGDIPYILILNTCYNIPGPTYPHTHNVPDPTYRLGIPGYPVDIPRYPKNMLDLGYCSDKF